MEGGKETQWHLYISLISFHTSHWLVSLEGCWTHWGMLGWPAGQRVGGVVEWRVTSPVFSPRTYRNSVPVSLWNSPVLSLCLEDICWSNKHIMLMWQHPHQDGRRGGAKDLPASPMDFPTQQWPLLGDMPVSLPTSGQGDWIILVALDNYIHPSLACVHQRVSQGQWFVGSSYFIYEQKLKLIIYSADFFKLTSLRYDLHKISCTQLFCTIQWVFTKVFTHVATIKSNYRTITSALKSPHSSTTVASVNCWSVFCHRGYFAFLRIVWNWILPCVFFHARLLPVTSWFWDSLTCGLYQQLIPFYSQVLSLHGYTTLYWSTLSFLKHFFHKACTRNPSLQPPSLDFLVSLTPSLGSLEFGFVLFFFF